MMKVHKNLFVILLLTMMGFMSRQSLSAQEMPEQVDGFYQIYTASHLDWLYFYFNSMGTGAPDPIRVRLMADISIDDSYNYIDLEAVADWIKNGMDAENRWAVSDIQTEWSAIGYNADYPFMGEFDGNHHTISNVFPTFDYLSDSWGIFGYAKNAYIHDLTVENIALVGYEHVGLVGVAQEGVTIERCAVINSITSVTSNSETNCGGVLVGQLAAGCKVTDCLVSNYLTDISNTTSIGGLCGLNQGTFTNCLLNGYPKGIAPCAVVDGTGTFGRCLAYSKYSTAPINVSGISKISSAAIKGGYACYTLNGDGRDTIWHQHIGPEGSGETDAFPRPSQENRSTLVNQSSHGGIYYNSATGEEPEDEFFYVMLCDEKGLSQSSSIPVGTVAYIRDVPDPYRRWHSVCFPFPMYSGYVNPNYTLFEIGNIVPTANNQYLVNLVRVDTLLAGMPGFIYKNDPEYELHFYFQNVGELTTVTRNEPFGPFTFMGVHDALTFTENLLDVKNIDYYYLAKDAIYHATKAFTIAPYRAYLYHEDISIGAAPARLVMNVVDSETTGIRTLEEEKSPATHYTDLMGRPVDPSTLGIKITNHKKTFVR